MVVGWKLRELMFHVEHQSSGATRAHPRCDDSVIPKEGNRGFSPRHMQGGSATRASRARLSWALWKPESTNRPCFRNHGCESSREACNGERWLPHKGSPEKQRYVPCGTSRLFQKTMEINIFPPDRNPMIMCPTSVDHVALSIKLRADNHRIHPTCYYFGSLLVNILVTITVER
jgi:hypothetical protein